MARNDGIDRTVARNQDLETPADVAKVQEHNEREKDSYSNQDIVPERTSLNVHFKAPTDDYVKMFEQMEQDGVISTRGLKPDAVKYGELVFDVNSAYFYNHGGYEFAKQFYADAYKAAVEIVGGEQYILSAVMHADERNRAMSEALGEDVYHYGGRLPVHVRCLIDECANIGQIPKLEKLVATIRSREISACLVLQAQSQLKAIYKDNADTIIGNMDTSIFLGGKEPTTLKELAAVLGKETIDTYNTGESRGRETSHSLNYQKLGKDMPYLLVKSSAALNLT